MQYSNTNAFEILLAAKFNTLYFRDKSKVLTERCSVSITQKSASEFLPANPLQEDPTRCNEASDEVIENSHKVKSLIKLRVH